MGGSGSGDVQTDQPVTSSHLGDHAAFLLDKERRMLDVHRQLLRRSYQHEAFRGVQEEAFLEWSVRSRNCVVVWKTGGSKTALFGLSAVFHSYAITVVVLPLIALIEDAYRQLIIRHIALFFFTINRPHLVRSTMSR